MEDRGEDCRRAFELGAARYPGVTMDVAAFAIAWEEMEGRRAARAAGGSPAGRSPPAGAGPGDVFLAVACAQRVAGAWEAFEREYAARVRGLLRKRGASDAEADEFVADMAGYLFQPAAEADGRARIGTYDGSASLFSWLAVIALRNVNHRRSAASGRAAALESGGDVATRRGAPLSAAIGTETARRFRSALAAAWETLTPRERLAVLLRYRDHLRGTEIARLLGVGEPRVTRLLEAGLGRLRDAVRRAMPETPPGTGTPDQAVWHAMGDVLAKHLATLEPARHDQSETADE